MSQNLIVFLLRNFWRIFFCLLGLTFGISCAIFGFKKTFYIVMLGLLGFYVGKWMDEGRPDGGLFRFLRRYFD